MVRASDYGPFGSPMVWPKVSINGRCFAVRKASIGAPAAGSAPGAIVARDDSPGLHIATATQSIHLEAFSRLEGKTLEVTEVATLASLQPGGCVTWPTEEVKKQITEVGRIASKATAYWRERLLAYKPYRLPYSRPVSAGGEVTSPITETCHVMPEGVADGMSFIEYLIGGWCTFLARASGIADVHVAIATPHDEVPRDYRDLFTAWVPLLAHIDAAAPIARSVRAIGDELRNVRQQGVIRRDLIGRDLNLNGRFERGELTPEIMISWGHTPAAHQSPEDRPALELLIQPDGGAIEFHYDPKKVSREDVGRLASQFSEWCRRLPSAMAQPLHAAAAVSEQEQAALIEDFNATHSDATLVAASINCSSARRSFREATSRCCVPTLGCRTNSSTRPRIGWRAFWPGKV